MTLAIEYQNARRDEEQVRLRRVLALRAMVAVGMSQREIAAALGVSQPAVSQHLKAGADLTSVHPEMLLEAAAPVLRRVADEQGFSELAVFGSVARHRARADSDIDLLVQEPPGTTIRSIVRLQRLFEEILGRSVDLLTYGGLKPGVDDDIRRDGVLL